MLYRFILICLLLSGCGYNLKRGDPTIPGVKNIFLDVVRNSTKEVGIERYFTSALYIEFTKSKYFNLVPRDNADNILETTIVNYSIAPVFFDMNNMAIQYRVKVTVRSVLRDKNHNIIFDTGEIVDEEEYFSADNVIDIKRNEAEAVDLIARDVAEEIHDLLLSGDE